ncbi:MAG: hypothetical protein HOE90_14330 [Bacteriovoracaceae bacterium]|nr:hypothetical protein [Bacteriovoracaceae bacterium]
MKDQKKYTNKEIIEMARTITEIASNLELLIHKSKTKRRFKVIDGGGKKIIHLKRTELSVN